MKRVELSLACYGHATVSALLDGRVTCEGVDLIISNRPGPEVFWRQLRNAEFDISEMSMSSLLMLVDRGRDEWVALPVFPMRHFFHADILVTRQSGIEKPADLRGKRVGVPDYQQTAALWTRGVLQHQFDVAAQDMTWFMERNPLRSHAGAIGFTAPEGVDISIIPEDKSIKSMMTDGEIDAAITYISTLGKVTETSFQDRSVGLPDPSRVKFLFDDPIAEGVRFWKATGLLPINHCIVIRRTIAEKYPWLALNLYAAFAEAKQVYQSAVLESLTPWLREGFIDAATLDQIRSDTHPYGLQANLPTINAISQYSCEQGLSGRQIKPDEYFASGVSDF